MSCPAKYDLQITDADGTSHGLIADWARQGAGLTIDPPNLPRSTDVATKGSYGTRDANDYFRIIQTDWSEGSAQELYDREADSESAFYSSSNIDVSKVGQFSLGPAFVTKTAATTTAALLAGLVDGSADPVVWRGDTAAPYIKYSKDNVTWSDPTATTYDPTAAPTSLCTDGIYVYGVFGGHVARVQVADITDFSADATNANLTHVAFTAGRLYATNSTTDQLGSFSTASPPVWTALSPTAGSAINLESSATFGLVAAGNFVYWGVSNGMVTKVYKAQYAGAGSTDILTHVATFPTGFVGACLYSYLDTVYVGGHFDGATADSGLGAIYAVIDDAPALLTDVGSDRTADNRVLAMTAYERSLYFVSNQHIWRWDLVHGGYSHYAGPVNSTTIDSTIVWTKTWDMTAEPTDCTITSSNAYISYNNGEAHLGKSTTSAASARFRSTGAISDTTGTTLEMDLAANAFSGIGCTQLLYLAILGSSNDVRLKFTYVSGGSYTVQHYSGTTLLANLGSFLHATPSTWRITLQNGSSAVWRNGVLLSNKTATVASSTARVEVFYEALSGGSATVGTRIDRVRWSDDGAYDPNGATSFSGYGMAAARDAVWVSGTGVEIKKTSGVATSGDLVSSQSSGNMPTVDKYFNAFTVQGANVVPPGATLGAHVTIDGVGPQSLVEDAAKSDDYLHWFPIGQSGRRVQTRIDLLASAYLALSGLDNGDTIIINNLTFTAHTNTTTVATRTFSIAGTDTADATELAVCINDPTYGVPGVTAAVDGAIVILTSMAGVIVEARLGTATAAECAISYGDSPVAAEIAVLFTPAPKTTKLYTYFIRCWDQVESRVPGLLWDEDAETVSDFLESIANTIVTVSRPGRDDYTGKVEGLEYIEAPPSGRANGREGVYKLNVRQV